MVFIAKLALVILIIHLKAHSLHAAIIIDRTKASISNLYNNNNHYNATNFDYSYNINSNNQSYNEPILRDPDNKSALSSKPLLSTNTVSSEYGAADNVQHIQGDNTNNNNTENGNNLPKGHVALTNISDNGGNANTIASISETTVDNHQNMSARRKSVNPSTNNFAHQYYGYEALPAFNVAQTSKIGLPRSGTSDVSTQPVESTGPHANLVKDFNVSDMEYFLLKYELNNSNTCLLEDIKNAFMWWSFVNGSLRTEGFYLESTRDSVDMSYLNISDDDKLYSNTRATTYVGGRNVYAFSAAHNNLTRAPYRTLSLFSDTLLYLSLRGNQFAAYTSEKQKGVITRLLNDTETFSADDSSTEEIDSLEALTKAYKDIKYYYENRKNASTFFGPTEEGIAWATFPYLPNLVELDISDCRIEYVTRDAFKNITNLRRLFISNNKMLSIPHDTFRYVPRLQYLDLSYINALGFDYQIPLATLEAVIHLIYGVDIQLTTFKYLPDLMFLDLSHTKLTRHSAMAFTHLGKNMKFLSLCYTAFPMVGNALFKNMGLIGLDLSGNPYATYNMIEDAFESVADTLEYLHFEQSNLKELNWLKHLKKLRFLGLAGNNINSVTMDIFQPLKNLEVLDLGSNHVGNWYNSAFAHNDKLRVLNLRDNNINIINPEMLKDFQMLDYLSLGDNNFVCDCLLRDLVEVASANNQKANCSFKQETETLITENGRTMTDFLARDGNTYQNVDYKSILNGMRKKGGPINNSSYNEQGLSNLIPQALMNRYRATLRQSYANLRQYNTPRLRTKVRAMAHNFYNGMGIVSSAPEQCAGSSPVLSERLNGSIFKFQLLDYEDDHYWCFNETRRMRFVQLECKSLTYADNLAGKIHKLNTIVVASVCSAFGLTLLGVILYLRRWHIHYYYSSLKSAALLAVATKDKVKKFNELAEQDPNLVYDIFISYCQNDREWVLDELLPNIEEAGNISICLHERDFQIGVAILDNIISCMDRSRALMLIISSNFLLSHWCQFEMHLAQHRIFEVSKEHLIIVFLEDIPRSKRPKTLQYLMEVKTYIKWPGATGKAVKPEERKSFWKRLQRSLELSGVPATQSHV